jgi:HD superfamily phosphohydrolase
MIKDTISLREAPTKFVKVKAHSGILWNEEADQQAASACHNLSFARLPNTVKLYPHQDSIMTDLNVRRLVKFQLQQTQREKVNSRLQTNFSYFEISVDLTIESHKLLKEPNIRAFRHKVMSKQLPTLLRNAKWSKETQEECLQTCRRCKEAKETIFHVWNCRQNDRGIVRDKMIEWLRPRLLKRSLNQFTAPRLVDKLLSLNPFYTQGMTTNSMYD